MTQIARRDVLRAGAGAAAMLAVGVPRAGAAVRARSDPGAETVVQWNGTLLVISEAGATVLTRFYGPARPLTVTSEVLPGVTRVFHRFRDAAEEAGRSRIYAGVHTRIDHDAGRHLGRDVARFVAARAGARTAESAA